MAQINYRLLRLEIANQVKKGDVAKKKIGPLLKKEFESRKQTFLLDELAHHPVTQELEGGPEYQGSKYVEGGNLYSLIGFNAGEDPVAAVREALDESVKLLPGIDVKTTGDKLTFSQKVSYPTMQEVSDVVAEKLPLEWTPRGFVDLIERGITGLPRYFFSLGPAFLKNVSRYTRSGTAIQKKNQLRGGSVGAIRYVSDILAKFKLSLKR